ncbi:hypothetical protein [Actinomyces viscosus]|nr:hypothetical protein [Actinomyces viscosus]
MYEVVVGVGVPVLQDTTWSASLHERAGDVETGGSLMASVAGYW